MGCRFWRRAEAALSYKTNRELVFVSWKLGLLYYVIVATVLLYVGVYSLWWERGYQGVSQVVGSVDAKVKGQAFAWDPVTSERMVWDSSDLVIQETFGFFVATKLDVTEQYRGLCPGNYLTEDCSEDDAVCVAGAASWNGIQTGRCLHEGHAAWCEVEGWCPVEGTPNATVSYALEGVEDFTIFIRINAKFPRFNDAEGHSLSWNNVNGSMPTANWNLFTLKELVESGGFMYEDVQDLGADFQIKVDFDCDFDKAVDKCSPELPFITSRIDTVDSELSQGYNFRAASHLRVPGSGLLQANKTLGARELTKLYGVRVRLQLSGQGRKFDLIELLTHLGSGLALLGLATVVADALLLYVFPNRDKFKGVKYTTYRECDHEDCQKMRDNSLEHLWEPLRDDDGL